MAVHFFQDAARLLKQGGVFTYFSAADVDICEEQREQLDRVGFNVVHVEQCEVPTPPNCQYWRAKTMVAPTCIKR